jgi:hypothetical protein
MMQLDMKFTGHKYSISKLVLLGIRFENALILRFSHNLRKRIYLYHAEVSYIL